MQQPKQLDKKAEGGADGGAKEDAKEDADLEIDEEDEEIDVEEEEEEVEEGDSGDDKDDDDDEEKEEKDNDDEEDDKDKTGSDMISSSKSKQSKNNDDECVYQFGEDGDYFGGEDGDDAVPFVDAFSDDEDTVKQQYVLGDDRISKKIMTTFEQVRILGERAKQLSLGAKRMIELKDGLETLDVKEIAKLELQEKKIPFRIIRPMTNGTMEIWDLHELEIMS
jgi:DNA-directed RNA polymerase subunit K/omega